MLRVVDLPGIVNQMLNMASVLIEKFFRSDNMSNIKNGVAGSLHYSTNFIIFWVNRKKLSILYDVRSREKGKSTVDASAGNETSRKLLCLSGTISTRSTRQTL